MPAEEEKEVQAAEEPTIGAEDIEGLVKELLEKGYTGEEVVQIIEQAASQGKLPPEAVEIAKRLADEELEYASSLFGNELN